MKRYQWERDKYGDILILDYKQGSTYGGYGSWFFAPVATVYDEGLAENLVNMLNNQAEFRQTVMNKPTQFFNRRK